MNCASVIGAGETEYGRADVGVMLTVEQPSILIRGGQADMAIAVQAGSPISKSPKELTPVTDVLVFVGVPAIVRLIQFGKLNLPVLKLAGTAAASTIPEG